MHDQLTCVDHPGCWLAHARQIIDHRALLLRDSGAAEMTPVVAGLLCVVTGAVQRAWRRHSPSALSQADADDLVVDIADQLLYRVLPTFKSTSPVALLACVKVMVKRQLHRRSWVAARWDARPGNACAPAHDGDEPSSYQAPEAKTPDEQRADERLIRAQLDAVAWDAKLPAALRDLADPCAVVSGIYVYGGVRAFARTWGRDKDQVHRLLKEARQVLARRGAEARDVAMAVVGVRVSVAPNAPPRCAPLDARWGINKV